MTLAQFRIKFGSKFQVNTTCLVTESTPDLVQKSVHERVPIFTIIIFNMWAVHAADNNINK